MSGTVTALLKVQQSDLERVAARAKIPINQLVRKIADEFNIGVDCVIATDILQCSKSDIVIGYNGYHDEERLFPGDKVKSTLCRSCDKETFYSVTLTGELLTPRVFCERCSLKRGIVSPHHSMMRRVRMAQGPPVNVTSRPIRHAIDHDTARKLGLE